MLSSVIFHEFKVQGKVKKKKAKSVLKYKVSILKNSE